MGQAAVALLMIGQPLAVLATVLLPAVAMARRAAPAAAVALWGLALALLTWWAGTTYRTAVQADPADIEVEVLGSVHWLGLALGAAVGSLLVAHRSPGRNRQT